MLVTSEHHWQSSQPVLFHDRRTEESTPSTSSSASSSRPNGEWDLSELFHTQMDARSIPAGGFAHPMSNNANSNPPQHQDYNMSHTSSDYPEHSYDLFNSAPTSGFSSRAFAAASDPSTFSRTTLSPQQRAGDMFGTNYSSNYSSSASSPAAARSPAYSSLGSVPEDSVISGMAAAPTSSFTSGTISPNALAAGERYPPEPSFAELMMDRPSPAGLYSSPRSAIHNNNSHLPRSQQQPQFSFISDPSSSVASHPNVPRQFDTHSYSSSYDTSTQFDRSLSHGNEVPFRAAGPYLNQYVHAPNRLAAGEQTVIVMSSRVAQKSYGNEKRFLCPPPTAVLLGHAWWSDQRNGGVSNDGSRPPSAQVTISISGEAGCSDGVLEWSTPMGKPIDQNEAEYGDESGASANGTGGVAPARIGRCVGKQLFISDVDERKKRVEALVKINVTAQRGDRLEEHIVGTFSSRPIKVISKPSKKRQSAKNLELCINHGSTVSLFHRLRSQTVSTKYLCVSGSGASFKGSDGAALPGLDSRQRTSAPSFIAKTASWDMFIIYIVDVNKPSSGPESVVPPPFHPDYPPPPPNAIPCSPENSSTPIYYNQTVVLQCLTSGVVSPVLVIRKVDHSTVVVGGGLAESTKGVPDHYCIPGEVCGDPVSQLHKIAFEVYEPGLSANAESGGPGFSGAFLSCMGEKVNTYRPVDVRQWNGAGNISPERSVSGSPLTSNSTLTSKTGSPDPPYFPPPHMQNGGMQGVSNSADAFEFLPDGGRVRRKRGSLSGPPPSAAKVNARGRRRVDSVSSVSSRASVGETSVSGALWSIDIGETAVWTIVGTDQVRYNFFVPPTVSDTRTLHLPPNSVTPALIVHKSVASDPAGAVSIQGENFSKNDPPAVFFGAEQSTLVEVRSSELLVCRPPASDSTGLRRPIVLVRSDGVVFPSSILYP